MPSQKQFIQTLRYFPDSAKLFSSIADKPWAVFLDSGYPYCNQGRFDIIAYDPVCTLVTKGDITEISSDGLMVQSCDNPFELVKQQLLTQVFSGFDDLPFNGGAIGYFSYDLARRLEKLPVIAENAEYIPDMMVGIYEWALIVDHYQQKSFLVGHCGEWQKCQELAARFEHLQEGAHHDDFKVLSPVRCNMDRASYSRAFNRIKHYLKEGDCYQVNLAQRFVADCKGDPWLAYQSLRGLNAAPFSGYLNLPDVQILSSSPERFLKLTHGIVETKPIKGTRPRKQLVTEDWQQIRSPLDRLIRGFDRDLQDGNRVIRGCQSCFRCFCHASSDS